MFRHANHSPFIPWVMQPYRLFPAWFMALFLLSANTLAQEGLVDDEQDDEAEEWPIPQPVETGPGGSIKIESAYRAEAEAEQPVHFHALWESRYVTEGRDNLSGKSLASMSSDITRGNFTFAPWLAYSDSADYKELDLNFLYGIPLHEKLIAYAGFTHIRSHDTGSKTHDNEVSLDLVYTGNEYIDTTLSWYYSFTTDSSFYDLILRNEQFINDKLTIHLNAIAGFNAGYIQLGHDGLNYTQLRLNLAYHPWSQTEVTAYVGYNHAIDSDPEWYAEDANLSDFAWGGFGMIYRF